MKRATLILYTLMFSLCLTACSNNAQNLSSASKESSTIMSSSVIPIISVQKEFKEISVSLKVIPVDFKSPESGNYRLVEINNGIETKIFAPLRLYNPQLLAPIYKVSNDSYILCYKGPEVSYKIGSGIMRSILDGEDLSEGGKEYGTNMSGYEGIIIMSLSYNPINKLGTGISYQELDLQDDTSVISVFSGIPGEFNQGVVKSTYLQIQESKKNQISIKSPLNYGNVKGVLKEEYTHFLASANADYLYYDNFDDDLIPKIFKIKQYEQQDKATVYKTKSCTPVVSNDNTIFAYNYSENASFSKDTKWQTIIEKNAKEVKKFDTKRIIIMDEQDKEIYAIDPQNLTLEVLDMASLQVKITAKMDKGFIFPQIINGKLQYTCPVYNGNAIENYVVKEEQ